MKHMEGAWILARNLGSRRGISVYIGPRCQYILYIDGRGPLEIDQVAASHIVSLYRLGVEIADELPWVGADHDNL